MVSSRSVSKRRLHGLLDQLRTPVELVVRPHRGMEQLYRRFGPVYTVGAGRARTVFLLGPEANKFVLGHSELFRWREAFETLTVVGGDTALIVSDGSAHQRRRRLVAPAFGARRVEGYATSMRAHIDAAIDAWRPGQLLDLYRELRQVVRADTIEVLFGPGLAADEAQLGRLLDEALAWSTAHRHCSSCNVSGCPRGGAPGRPGPRWRTGSVRRSPTEEAGATWTERSAGRVVGEHAEHCVAQRHRLPSPLGSRYRYR